MSEKVKTLVKLVYALLIVCFTMMCLAEIVISVVFILCIVTLWYLVILVPTPAHVVVIASLITGILAAVALYAGAWTVKQIPWAWENRNLGLD
jgi:hypothetical protein